MKKLLLSLTILLSFSALAQPPAYVPTNGLVGWWPFNANANDESGLGNHGFTFGVNTPTLQTDRFGNANSSYYFYGETGEIKIPTSNSALLLNPLLDSYSVSFWLKSIDPTLTTSTGLALHQWGGNTIYSYPFSFQIGGTSNILQPKVYDGVNVNITTVGDFVFDDQWHMITLVKDNQVDSIFSFADGVLLDAVQFTLNGPLDPIYDTIRVGPRFLGQIDDISIYNRPLSLCEIQDLYNAGVGTTSSVTQSGATLTADQAGATYQWLDCDNSYAVIAGETNQSYTPTNVTGNFAVEVTLNGCVDTSACYHVDYTGIEELNHQQVFLTPNPTSDFITIEGIENVEDIKSMELVSSAGRVIAELKVGTVKIDVSTLSSGTYFLSITQANGTERLRFVKE